MAEDSPTLRSLVVGLLTLVLVAVIIGGVFSLFALGAVNVTGLAKSGPAPKPSMYVPPLKKHPSGPSGSGAAPVAQSPSASASPSASPTPTPHHQKRGHRIQLSADPLHVAPSQRIVLSGTYPGANGSTLQVQNRQRGRWTSFPVTVTVTGGSFQTYIYSGDPGRHRFRVVDPGSGHASNPVTVTIS
jgi:hypothetical protein